MSILDSIQKLIKNDSYASSPAIKNYKSLVDTLKTTNKSGAKSDIVLDVLNAGSGSNSWSERFGGGASSLADILNPSTYLNAAAGVTHSDDSPVQQAVSGSANQTMENATAFLAQGASRAIVIVLGFIFVAVGLVLFKPAIVVSGIPAPVKGAFQKGGDAFGLANLASFDMMPLLATAVLIGALAFRESGKCIITMSS